MAVDFFIEVCLAEWDDISDIGGSHAQLKCIECHTHKTKVHPVPKYDFDKLFYKFPSYLRRAAISAAIGKVSSYQSSLANYEAGASKGKPSIPKAGHVFPTMYRDNCAGKAEHY